MYVENTRDSIKKKKKNLEMSITIGIGYKGNK